MSAGASTVRDPELADGAARQLHARIGQVIGERWRVDALLGSGGTAAVYSATHRNGRRVALKILHRELGDDAIRARFLREAYLANRVPHPGAVAILDDAMAPDGSPVLVMELLEGETIEQRWQRTRNPLDAGEVLSVIDQVLDVLAAAHTLGIVHRDLKPSNLFLTHEGRVKLLDFGIAHLRDASGTTATQPGLSMGTPAFMAPEQARGRWELVDARTDLWALGATMFALLSGRFVHEADTLNEQLLAAMTVPAPPLASVAPHVPPAVAAVVDRALSFERDRRFQDALAMQHAVREAYQTLSQTVSSHPPSNFPGVEVPTALGPHFMPPLFTPSLTTSSGMAGSPRVDRESRRTGLMSAIGLAIGIITSLAVVAVFLFVEEGHPVPRLRATSALATAHAAAAKALAAVPAAPAATETSAEALPSAAPTAPPVAKPPPRPVRPSAPRPRPRPKVSDDPMDQRK
jgi:serine/threonine-protein kinase